ncbi:MAG: DUF2520 domain-containing protein [Chitinophagales bacterium]|nr:DUF2520 domain-containing protein [Chitinophagales bacterium]
MNITILGAGNVATQLALGLRKAGHSIVQIFNRSDNAGQELARAVGASFTSDARSLQNADVYIIAVKDDAIADVASLLKAGDKIVVHTSGTKTKDLLSFCSANYGIFYPLQTMTKLSKVDFSNVPVLIEGNNEATLQLLETLARSLSKQTHKVTEEQRQWIHVAAVFANNFTNHLFAVSEEILTMHGLDFEILKPLIFRSIENLREHSPAVLQTGPAARRDKLTIERHLALLEQHKNFQELYRLLSDSITATQSKR